MWLGPDRSLDGAREGAGCGRPRPACGGSRTSADRARPAPRRDRRHACAGASGSACPRRARASAAPRGARHARRPLEPARRALTEAVLRREARRLGDTPFALARSTLDLPEGAMIPISSLNRARRALGEALIAASQRRSQRSPREPSTGRAARRARTPARPAAAGLFVLCAHARAGEAAARRGCRRRVPRLPRAHGHRRRRASAARAEACHITWRRRGSASPARRRSTRYLRVARRPTRCSCAASARWRRRGQRRPPASGTSRSTSPTASPRPRCSRAGSRVHALLRSRRRAAPRAARHALRPLAEVVVHHPMPLFHMEHCVIAALLSDGRDHKTCGRPCERHKSRCAIAPAWRTRWRPTWAAATPCSTPPPRAPRPRGPALRPRRRALPRGAGARAARRRGCASWGPTASSSPASARRRSSSARCAPRAATAWCAARCACWQRGRKAGAPDHPQPSDAGGELRGDERRRRGERRAGLGERRHDERRRDERRRDERRHHACRRCLGIEPRSLERASARGDRGEGRRAQRLRWIAAGRDGIRGGPSAATAANHRHAQPPCRSTGRA
jgi:hypothetical protein